MKSLCSNHVYGITPAVVVLAAMLCSLPACSPSNSGPLHDNGTDYTIINNTFSITASKQPWIIDGDESKVAGAFSANDKVSVFAFVGSEENIAGEQVVDNVVNIFDGKQWQPEREMQWKSAVDKHDFIAVYPSIEGGIDPTGLDYDVSYGDVMIATASSKYTSSPVNLEFGHLFGRLDVSIMAGNGLGNDVVIKGISLNGIRKATVNCLTGTVVPGINAVDIDMTRVGEETNGVSHFSGIFLPAEYLPGSLKVKIEKDGEESEMKYSGLVRIETGKICRLKLILGEHSLTGAIAGTDGWLDGGSGDGQISQQF